MLLEYTHPSRIQRNTNEIFVFFLGLPPNIQALEQYVKSVPNTKDFQCGLCEYISNRPAKVKNHLEAIHFPGIFVYSCDLCEKTFSGRNAFGVHKSQVHSKKKSTLVFQESL